MSAKQSADNLAKKQKRWLRKLADEFIKLESSMPVENLLPDTGLPKWVENLEREVGATMHPVAKLKEELKLTPKRFGAILGHQCAIAVWQMEWIAKELQKPPVEVGDYKLTPEQLKVGEEFLSKLCDQWYPALRKLAKRALSSCVDQPYEDMKEFLLAYASAFEQKPSGSVSNIGHSAFQIYNFMLFNWRMVDRLNSVHHLHEVLVKIFGPYRVGDLKRTEKICQRIGLSYRKAGRPKKQNNSDS
jgi:hypothetical protein